MCEPAFAPEKMTAIRKLRLKSICVIGANLVGVSVARVIAFKCPHLSVSVTDFDLLQVNWWEENNPKKLEPAMEELTKSRLENLFFGTNIKESVSEADIVLITTDSGDNEEMSEIRKLEKIMKLIAEVTEENKIIVQKSENVPIKTCETLIKILDKCKQEKASFQVLSMPEFFTSPSVIAHLLNPDFVFIGHEVSLEGKKAAGLVMELYTKWVPKERIKLMDYNLLDVTRLCLNALLADKYLTLSGILGISEMKDKNSRDTALNFMKTQWFVNRTFSLCDVNMYRDLIRLNQLCKRYNMKKQEEYWGDVINQHDYMENMFRKKILSTFCNVLNYRKFAFLGVMFSVNKKLAREEYSMRLGKKLLEEGAVLSLYDPRVELNLQTVHEVFKAAGVEKVEQRVSVYTDPYEASRKADALMFCVDLDNPLDFVTLYKEMNKPAYIFDGCNALDYKTITQIGFHFF